MAETDIDNIANKNMNYSIASAIAAVAICMALALTVGCTSNKPYRTSFNTTDPIQPGPDLTKTVIEATPDYKLGFVEFDEQGWFWDVKQKEAVEKLIRSECGIGSGQPSAAIMVLFVHGWKNNAAYDNTNVATFRAVLKQLSDLEKTLSQKENRPARKMIGIFGGWRGLSLTSDYFPPLGMETSFWSRKRAAQRVGGYGALSELMLDLAALQKNSNQTLSSNSTQTKLIIVGHSFGADAVYNATSQILTEKFVDTIKQKPGELLKPLGDQVILLNPAFEATRFFDLDQLARSVNNYPTNQRPVISVFQSRGDWATHTFFPIGQQIATFFQQNRDDFQKQSGLRSVGWFTPFVTHNLDYETNIPGTITGRRPDAAAQHHELRTSDKLPNAVTNILQQRQVWRAGSDRTTNYFGNCVLTSLANYQPRNPIVVVSVSTEIMKDHDDIGNPTLINFIQEYIPFCDDEPSLGSSPK
jgi:Alpha/beta hydrolase of unknown function (DUF900)